MFLARQRAMDTRQMISRVRFCINHAAKIRRLDLNDAELSFEPGYNILIGPNGAGKSTVLRAIATCELCELEKAGREIIKYITTETLNPLVGGTFASREEMIQGIRAMFHSHGQGVLDTLRSQMHAGETVVLIDSPETGQDHDNSVFIHEGLLAMSQRYQVIVATNSLVFMQGGNLIDLGRDTLAQLVQASGDLAVNLGYGPGASVATPQSKKKKTVRRD